MRCALLVLGLLLSVWSLGCTLPVGQCNGDWTYSGFADADRARMAKIEGRWNEFSSSPVTLREGPPRAFCHVSAEDLEPEGEAGHYSANLKHETIKIDVPRAAYDFEAVLLHELGHAHNMGHVDGGSIMHASAHGDWNEADRAECVRAGAC